MQLVVLFCRVVCIKRLPQPAADEKYPEENHPDVPDEYNREYDTEPEQTTNYQSDEKKSEATCDPSRVKVSYSPQSKEPKN